VRRAESGGRPDREEEDDGNRAQREHERVRTEQALGRWKQRVSERRAIEDRPRPQCAEQDERDDEDDRGPVVEEPDRDGQVLDAADPVRRSAGGEDERDGKPRR
jgi:hypothetical protein